jgi:ubiquinol-cytochrome c reductase cytochrome c1 subunit
MKKLILLCTILLASVSLLAAGGSDVSLQDANINAQDEQSRQRGMKIFVNYCLGCHSAKYQRYERAAEDLRMSADLVLEHLVFGDQKVGEHMTNTMLPAQAAKWFGVAPPDLTNVVNFRSVDWVYSYLLGFYADSNRPYGVNNTIFKNVGMPNVLSELQGIQEKVCEVAPSNDEYGNSAVDIQTVSQQSCKELKVRSGTGTMGPDEFEQTVRDLTNFMAYMSNPNAAASKRIGTYTIIFLLLLTTLFYFLYKEYWRNLH